MADIRMILFFFSGSPLLFRNLGVPFLMLPSPFLYGLVRSLLHHHRPTTKVPPRGFKRDMAPRRGSRPVAMRHEATVTATVDGSTNSVSVSVTALASDGV